MIISLLGVTKKIVVPILVVVAVLGIMVQKIGIVILGY
jgi:hypothetical protein